jgi:glycosyltransferase involved in cell wall biosynthesis
MKVTYTAPNRSHHYPYAEQLQRLGHLHAFVSGFSRLSPRSPLPAVGDKLKRHDVNQTLMLLSDRLRAPAAVTDWFRVRSDRRLDEASYRWAAESDVFLFYRTEGIRTAQRLRKEGAATRRVMEEVNSHVVYANRILREEYEKLGRSTPFQQDYDYDLRLRTYEEADYILTPSEFVKRSFVEQGIPAEKLLKVNFGFRTFESNAAAEREQDDNTFRVLYVGQINYRKGLRYALQAFAKLKHPKKEFVIVGPETKITGLERTPIPDHVTFTGTLKGDELMHEYRRATIFVLPSLEEGLSLVQGEALSFGLPLLITTNTGGDDLITDGVEGFIVPPADADALLERMQEMADRPELIAEMAERATAATERLGSWDKSGEKLAEELQRTL